MIRRVTLTLAQGGAHPGGCGERGYRICAPLRADGCLDPALWQAMRGLCQVERFWTDEATRHGRLVYEARGVTAPMWLIVYDEDAGGSELRHRLGAHVLVMGACVAVRDGMDGTMRTFVVTAVEPGP